MAGQTKDMTTGSSTTLILTFGLPLLAGNILQQLYNMVDTIVVGRGVGVDALAAVGATGSINFLVLGLLWAWHRVFLFLWHSFLAQEI